MLHRLVLAVLAGAWLAPRSALPLAPPPQPAELAGERLEFRIRWGIVPAAEASLEVVGPDGGRLQFRARARTRPWLDLLYPVRDRIDSTVLPRGPRPLRYLKRYREGRSETQETELRFDRAGNRVFYSHNGQLRRVLEVPPGVQDPLSALYAYRTAEVPEDRPVRLEVTDGRIQVAGVVRVLDREVVETPAGRFATVLVEPHLGGIAGIFQERPGARILIWLTDDRWRRPVKLQSEVSVGHFTAEVVRIQHPAERRPGR